MPDGASITDSNDEATDENPDQVPAAGWDEVPHKMAHAVPDLIITDTHADDVPDVDDADDVPDEDDKEPDETDEAADRTTAAGRYKVSNGVPHEIPDGVEQVPDQVPDTLPNDRESHAGTH